jgi:hypothetical protein
MSPVRILPRLKVQSPSMEKLNRLGWVDGICFASYGLRIGVRVNDPELLARVPAHLPPGWRPARSPVVDRLYSIRAGASDSPAGARRYSLLYEDPLRVARSRDVAEVLDSFEHAVQMFVAETAPRRVFVHAGVVGWRGRAIVIPGPSYSGKSTLVAALVRAGATYYSDEYAVFDAQGRVHPYPRRLSLREQGFMTGRPRRCSPEELGGHSGVAPLPVGLVVVTEYQAGARWRPHPMSAGPTVLALLANTVPARSRPAAALTALRHVVTQATTLKGKRGGAEELVERLLKLSEA